MQFTLLNHLKDDLPQYNYLLFTHINSHITFTKPIKQPHQHKYHDQENRHAYEK